MQNFEFHIGKSESNSKPPWPPRIQSNTNLEKSINYGYIFPYSVTFCHTPTKNPRKTHPLDTQFPPFLIKFHCIPFVCFWLFLNKKFGCVLDIFGFYFSFLLHSFFIVEGGLRVGWEWVRGISYFAFRLPLHCWADVWQKSSRYFFKTSHISLYSESFGIFDNIKIWLCTHYYIVHNLLIVHHLKKIRHSLLYSVGFFIFPFSLI